ncbi:MAG: ribonuclease E activity regulator RraA [Variovorax sp.]
MEASTADLCDKFGAQVQVCCAPLHSFGARRSAQGAIACLRTFEDAALLRDMLDQPGHGRVLVVDGDGSIRVALLGEKIARLGKANGWSGVVINGAVRDVDQLKQIDLAVFALGKAPMRGGNLGGGEQGIPVRFGGTDFLPNDFICLDADGLVVIPGLRMSGSRRE